MPAIDTSTSTATVENPALNDELRLKKIARQYIRTTRMPTVWRMRPRCIS